MDYRKLRPWNLNDPAFCHLKLLLGWILYFALYFVTERRIPMERCHVIYCVLDDLIPFCEWFVLFYVLWYGLILFSLGYFLLYRVQSFRKLQIYMILVQLLATAVYILYPSCQQLRPAVFPRQNAMTALLGLVYRIDTPTGVCPSLHVAISVGMAVAWLAEKTEPVWLRGLIGLLCLGVCLSVCFVKQHSVLDVLAAVPVSLLALRLCKLWR